MNKTRALCALVAAVLLMPLSLNAAELRFSRHLGHGMIIQRDKPVIVTGFAEPGSEVTVELAGKTQAAKSDDAGAWRVRFGAMPANAKGQTLSAKSASGEVSLTDVLIGDVFLFARQSTIDISLGRDAAGRQAAAADTPNPLYRAITIQTVPATEPQSDLAKGATRGWAPVDQASALTMSAAAYYFGRDLAQACKVPVGVIDLHMGCYFPVGWLSRETQLNTAKIYGKADVESNLKRMENLADLRSKGEPLPRKEVISSDPKQYALYPAAGYNAVIHPLKGLAMKGIVLQLGGNYPYMFYSDLEKSGKDRDRPELNRAYTETYNTRKVGFRMDPLTTPRIPKEWRQAFADQSLPMAWMMPPSSALSTFAEHGMEMRELQRLMARDNPDLGIILPGYENVPFSAQPRDEALLAERSLKWALGAVYHQKDFAASGPLFEKLETKMNTATVYFKEGTAQGLKAAKGSLDAFEASGVDGIYSPAMARIDGSVIRIESDTISRIVHVRYNWKKSPDQGLTNASGLPAVPFRSQKVEYNWFIRNTEGDLPMEYSTPANQWSKNDVTLVNGQLKTHGYKNFTGWLGPVGVRVGPFGPNMGVREIAPGSPAAGKLFDEDVIYSVNGTMLGEQAERTMAAAITESETHANKGKLVLGVRRGAKNIDVELTLEVMGAYSPTAPYDCPKTEKIVTHLENYLVEHGGGSDFLATDTLFLLAAGNPKHQGLVRRKVYKLMNTKGDNNWSFGYCATLVAEYYLATGDKTVLPYLQKLIESIVANQIKEPRNGQTGRVGGWYGRGLKARGYPAMPHAGLACMLGMTLAKEAGVPVDEDAYQLGLKHFSNKGADVGIIIYGNAYRDRPYPMNPDRMKVGKLTTDNGKTAIAAVLYQLADHPRTAHLCSLISSYSYNHTFDGHGGNFWNNFWTPLGANVHGKAAFLHFWKGHRWYREMNRMFDGSLIINEGARLGGGQGLPLVVPRQRLRILGAPASPFAVNAPQVLKPALAAYAQKDYSGCENLLAKLLASGTIEKDDRPRVERLAQVSREMRQSITSDLNQLDVLIKEGKMTEARVEFAQLKGVVDPNNPRLAAVKAGLKGDARADDQALYDSEQKAMTASGKSQKKIVEQPRHWKPLVTEIPVSNKEDKLGKVPAEQANLWRLKVVESAEQAPEDWVKPDFDDTSWNETNLPISWRMYHTALLRTTFNVEDKNAFDGLRIRGWFFRQLGLEVYLNGELVAKVNNLEKKTSNVEAILKQSAIKHLKNGKNTLAVTSRHNWRWGMLFMRVYNDGFGFRLDAQVKE